MNVLERDDILPFLKERNMFTQYKKAKYLLKKGLSKQVLLKKRKPKTDGIWQFRINKKYRAFCYFEKENLIVFKISDHQ
jgi:hypothetical protein